MPFEIKPRGNHPAQVVGRSIKESPEPEVCQEDWQPWEGEGGGWIHVPTGRWQQEKPKLTPPRNQRGQFTR